MTSAAKLIISGLVQGVGFRYFAYRHATALGLTGYVKNLYSGEVEVLVQGEEAAVQAFISEMRIGPRSAYVKSVNITPVKYDPSITTFEVRY